MQNAGFNWTRLGRKRWWLASLAGLLIALAPAISDAAPLAEEAVRASVQTWVRHMTADARMNAVIETIEPRADDSRTYAYVARLEGGGYCLCGADDRLLPVYLYSPRGSFDPRDPNNACILGEIKERLAALQAAADRQDSALNAYATELSRRASVWRDLSARRVPAGGPADGPKTVSSLVLPVTSRWHQDSPYNDNCPNLTPGQDERTVVGCVATAMSQIMYYWKWPAAGTGTVPTPFPYRYRFSTTWLTEPLVTNPTVPVTWSNRLVWDTGAGGTLRMTGYWDEESVYYKATQINTNADYLTALAALWSRMTQGQFVPSANLSAPINWSLLQDEHSDPVDSGDAAVAALCSAVGVTTYMHYGLWFTSGFDTHVPEALKLYFFYDPDTVYQAKNEARMIEDIQWLRPVEMGGAGHSWVVCGYNTGTTPTQFLMNLGWGGSNAWYTCDQVFPVDQGITTRIAPLNTVKFVGAAVLGDGSPSDPYVDVEQALANAPDGATLIFKAGSDNTFSATSLTISRPMTLKGADATIRKQ